MLEIDEIEKQRGFKLSEAEKKEFEKRSEVLARSIQSSLTSLLPVVGVVLNTIELEERLYKVEEIILSQKFDENAVNLISFRNVLNKYLLEEIQLDDKIVENVLMRLNEKTVTKESLVKFNELSCYMHNILFELLSDYKQNSVIRGDCLFFPKKEIDNKLSSFEINQLVSFGIFERITGGMSYGGSSNNFNSLKLNKTFNEFIKNIYNIDVQITPIKPCEFANYRNYVNKEMAKRLQFNDPPSIYKNNGGDKYEDLITNSKAEVKVLYQSVADLETKYKSVQELTHDEYAELLPQSLLDKKEVNKFDEEFALWCINLEKKTDYKYLKNKYGLANWDSNVNVAYI